MKFIKILFGIICIFLITPTFAAYQLYADIDGICIPYKTKLELEAANDISTTSVAQGDIIQAYLVQDLYVNKKLVLPSRTPFRGRVSQVKYSKSLSRPAVLYINLDHLITKTGAMLPINAGIATDFGYIIKSDGSLTTNGNYFSAVKRDAKKAGNIVKRTVQWGKTSGDDLFKGAKFVFVPVAALGGSVACAGSAVYNTIADLFRHGDEIIIKKGTKFHVILLSDLDIPS